MEKEVGRLVKPGPVREALMVPWRLDGANRPPNVEVMAEVEAALGTVLGAASPAEGFRRLVARQGTGAVVAGGSWAGKIRLQHQVHTMQEAGAGAEEEEAAAAREGTERDEEWVQQAGWGARGAARGRRCWWVDRRMCQRRQGRCRLV